MEKVPEFLRGALPSRVWVTHCEGEWRPPVHVQDGKQSASRSKRGGSRSGSVLGTCGRLQAGASNLICCADTVQTLPSELHSRRKLARREIFVPKHTHRATTTQARTHSGPGDTKLPGTVALKLNLRLGDLDVQTAYCDFNKDQPSLLLEIPLNHEQIFEAVVSARCLGLSRSSARTLLRRFFTFAGSVCTPPVKTFAFLYITGSTLRTCASTYCMVLLHTIHLLGLCTAQSSVGFRFHRVSGFLDNAALAESSCGFLDNAALAKSSRREPSQPANLAFAWPRTSRLHFLVPQTH